MKNVNNVKGVKDTRDLNRLTKAARAGLVLATVGLACGCAQPIVAWVPLQASSPQPGVANTIFRDIASIMTPKNIPFQMGGTGKSGL